jgi:rhodanese-related sulfurtransferase
MTKAVLNTVAIVLLALIAGAIAGIASASFSANTTETQEELIKEFYDVENAVHVSPHSIRKSIANGNLGVTLVDLRSAQEYAEEHIIGAINIPAYRDLDTPAHYDVERIVGAFAQLPQDKDIIVYCYSAPCMTGRKIGQLLAHSGIYVKHLGIGWNEWRYHWTLWNHPHEWNTTRAEDYVARGTQPGAFVPKH